MLIFEPDPPRLHRTPPDGPNSTEPLEFGAGPALAGSLAQAVDAAAAVGYVLVHGAEVAAQPAVALTPELLGRLEACVPYWPITNRLTLDLARAVMARRPEASHILLCDTAFFAGLPPLAHTCALPEELRAHGVRRFGGDGLCYQWLARQVARIAGPHERMVGVHLCDNPTVAALLDGRPVETSRGFSPLEGPPSAHGCGDIDPAIVLLLCSAGMPVAEVTRQLAQTAGFEALLGRPGTLRDVLAEASPRAELARGVLRLALVKAIGAHLAVLGGADVLAFACDSPDYHSFVLDLCRDLDFVGLDRSALAGGGVERASGASHVRVLELPYPRAAALAELAAGL